MKQVRNGDEVKEVITGFSGVVAGIASYLTGCDQALVIPKAAKDGTYKEGHWFDVTRLKVTKENVVKLPGEKKTSRPGGPQQSPPIS